MMNALHLFWIIPAATLFGFVLCALLSANKNDRMGGIMDNRCVCCGEVIPEGRMVCPNCEAKHKE